MMMTGSKTGFASLALLCGLGWLVVACPASLDDRCSDGACIASLTPEGGADADAAGDAPVTDPCIDNPTDLKCLDEATAYFVSPTGNDQDAAAGTRAIPFKTINAALSKIDTKRRRIYVCEGAYFEDLSLNATHSSLSIFGGIDCAWNAAPAIKPVIGASANPLKIDGTQALAIADIAVVAKDATTGSSIAAFVSGGDTTFKRVHLAAGKGAIGDNGIATPFTFPTQAALDGNGATDGAGGKKGGVAKDLVCPGGDPSKGGAGGDPGAPGATGLPALGMGAGGTLSDCEMNSAGGKKGANGTTPMNASGAMTIGQLQRTEWVPAPGEPGAKGGPGQGGGGGGGYLGAGGGGGAGGCGGAGGAPGKGGGASIALAVHEAKVALVDSSIETKGGGAGGTGTLGQTGQTDFGVGGNRNGSACNGGNGGTGGNGAAGGGGAGGSSIGIAYKGPKPEVDSITTGKIVVGAKGPGGQLAGTNTGVPGMEAAFFESK